MNRTESGLGFDRMIRILCVDLDHIHATFRVCVCVCVKQVYGP